MTQETREPEILCEVRQVDKDYDQGGGAVLRVLHGIDLAVKENEVVALLGPSGCGK